VTNDLDDPFLTAIAEFVALKNAQDLQGILRLMHKESFAYMPTQQLLLKLFAAFELQTSLLSSVFIARDDDYAYVRIKLRTEKLAGPDFKNNVTEFLVVFRMRGNAWRIWCQNPLSFDLLQHHAQQALQPRAHTNLPQE
jgi:hypothetical protein